MKLYIKELSTEVGSNQVSGGCGRLLLLMYSQAINFTIAMKKTTCVILELEILFLIFKILKSNSLDDFMVYGKKERLRNTLAVYVLASVI